VIVEFLRQLDLVAPTALETPVHVIGCGGIGSFAALALAKLGCTRLHLYDDDRVEEHNIPNQLFRLSDVGRPKPVALAEIVELFTGNQPQVSLRRVEAERLQGIVVSGVDSMTARKAIWRGSVRYRAGIPLYLDGRLGAEMCRVYAVRPTDPEDVRCYEQSLYADGQAVTLPCTAGAIIYTGFAVASLLADEVKKFAAGESVAREILYDLKTLTLIASPV
jgi:molybdopterin/thiamine biosynthesis adenylyltransferase